MSHLNVNINITLLQRFQVFLKKSDTCVFLIWHLLFFNPTFIFLIWYLLSGHMTSWSSWCHQTDLDQYMWDHLISFHIRTQASCWDSPSVRERRPSFTHNYRLSLQSTTDILLFTTSGHCFVIDMNRENSRHQGRFADAASHQHPDQRPKRQGPPARRPPCRDCSYLQSRLNIAEKRLTEWNDWY